MEEQRTILMLDSKSRLIIEAVRLERGFKTQSEATNFILREYAKSINLRIELGDQDE